MSGTNSRRPRWLLWLLALVLLALVGHFALDALAASALHGAEAHAPLWLMAAPGVALAHRWLRRREGRPLEGLRWQPAVPWRPPIGAACG